MAQKKSHEIDAWIGSARDLPPVVLFYGPDHGLVSERARRLAERTGLPLDDPFSVIRMDAGEAEQAPGRLTDEARTVPMFADRRLVWIRGAGAQKRLSDEVKSLIADPPSDAIILIEAGDLRKGSPLRAAAEQGARAMALPCYSDDARALDHVIDAEMQRAGLSIDLEARRILKASLGADRAASRGELEKLALYCAGRNSVTAEDVLALIGDVSTMGADEVVDHLLAGRLDALDAMFTRLSSSGAHPFVMLSAAMRQFQLLQRLRAGMDRDGKSAANVVAGARPPVFFARKQIVEAALARFDAAAIAGALERLQGAILRTRQMPEMAEPVSRQALMALAIESARRNR